MNEDVELWEKYQKQSGYQLPKTRNIKKLMHSLVIAQYLSKIEGLNNEDENFYLKIRDKIRLIKENNLPAIIAFIIIYFSVFFIYIQNNLNKSILINLMWALYICFLCSVPIALILILVNRITSNIRIKQIPEYIKFKQMQNKILNFKKSQLNFWNLLSGVQFEHEVENYFKSKGFQTELTKTTGDKGIDIILYHNTEKIIVQCKAYKKTIGVEIVRDLLGTLIDSKASKAILVSLNGFSKQVYDFISDKPILLLTIHDILNNSVKME